VRELFSPLLFSSLLYLKGRLKGGVIHLVKGGLKGWVASEAAILRRLLAFGFVSHEPSREDCTAVRTLLSAREDTTFLELRC
jgi:hypothetical protein